MLFWFGVIINSFFVLFYLILSYCFLFVLFLLIPTAVYHLFIHIYLIQPNLI